jgi:hypothetical protein
MVCAKCGGAVDVGKKFCTACGAPALPKTASTTAGRTLRLRRPRLIISAAAAVLLIGGGLFFWFSSGPDNSVELLMAKIAAIKPSAVIGPEGGTITAEGMTVQIPPGALKNRIAVTVRKVQRMEDFTPRPGTLAATEGLFTPISDVYQIEPAIYTHKPITIRLTPNRTEPTTTAQGGGWLDGLFCSTAHAATSPPPQNDRLAYPRPDGPENQSIRVFIRGEPAWRTIPDSRGSFECYGLVGGRYFLALYNREEWRKLLLRSTREYNPDEKYFAQTMDLFEWKRPTVETDQEIIIAAENRFHKLAERSNFPPLRVRALFWKGFMNELLFRQQSRETRNLWKKYYNTSVETYHKGLREFARTSNIQKRPSTAEQINIKTSWAFLRMFHGRSLGHRRINDERLLYSPVHLQEELAMHTSGMAPFGPEIYYYFREDFNSSNPRGRKYSFFDGHRPDAPVGEIPRRTIITNGGRIFAQSPAENFRGPEGLDKFSTLYPPVISQSVGEYLAQRSYTKRSLRIKVVRTMISPDAINDVNWPEVAWKVGRKAATGDFEGVINDMFFDEAVRIAKSYDTGATGKCIIQLAQFGEQSRNIIGGIRALTTPRNQLVGAAKSMGFRALRLTESITGGNLVGWLQKEDQTAITSRYRLREAPIAHIGYDYRGYQFPGTLRPSQSPVALIEVRVSVVLPDVDKIPNAFLRHQVYTFAFCLALGNNGRTYTPKWTGQDTFPNQSIDKKWLPIGGRWNPIIRTDISGPPAIVFRIENMPPRKRDKKSLGDNLNLSNAFSRQNRGINKHRWYDRQIDPELAKVEIFNAGQQSPFLTNKTYYANNSPPSDGSAVMLATTLKALGYNKPGVMPIPVTSLFRRNIYRTLSIATGLGKDIMSVSAFDKTGLKKNYRVVVTTAGPDGPIVKTFNVDFAKKTGGIFTNIDGMPAVRLRLGDKLDYVKILKELAADNGWPQDVRTSTAAPSWDRDRNTSANSGIKSTEYILPVRSIGRNLNGAAFFIREYETTETAVRDGQILLKYRKEATMPSPPMPPNTLIYEGFTSWTVPLESRQKAFLVIHSHGQQPMVWIQLGNAIIEVILEGPRNDPRRAIPAVTRREKKYLTDIVKRIMEYSE